MNIYLSIIAIIIAYLSGSICSAIITCKLMGLSDPRESGSNNPGASNVMRIGGKKPAIITLIGDLLKGYLPVQIIALLPFSHDVIAFAAVAAFLGHLYPVFFGFKGGKGVATGLGVILAMSPLIGCIIIAIWVLIFAIFRYSSLASLTACVLGIIYAWHMVNSAFYIAMVSIALMLIWRHRSNICRLINGQERQFSRRKK
jgi:acyl phosphate:glycerol-3-phosphate acyltransferase